MYNNLPLTFKAYLPGGQLLVSKPILPGDWSRIIDVYLDMHSLGVRIYFIKQGNTSKKHNLPTVCFQAVRIILPVHPSSTL